MSERELIEIGDEPPQPSSIEGLNHVIQSISSASESELSQDLNKLYCEIQNRPELQKGVFFQTDILNYQYILVIPFSHGNNGYTESLVIVSKANNELEYEINAGVVWNKIEEYSSSMMENIERGIYPPIPRKSDTYISRILKEENIYNEIYRVSQLRTG